MNVSTVYTDGVQIECNYDEGLDCSQNRVLCEVSMNIDTQESNQGRRVDGGRLNDRFNDEPGRAPKTGTEFAHTSISGPNAISNKHCGKGEDDNVNHDHT